MPSLTATHSRKGLKLFTQALLLSVCAAIDGDPPTGMPNHILIVEKCLGEDAMWCPFMMIDPVANCKQGMYEAYTCANSCKLCPA